MEAIAIAVDEVRKQLREGDRLVFSGVPIDVRYTRKRGRWRGRLTAIIRLPKDVRVDIVKREG